ncbi:uncharacterized protein LOC126651563 [Myiozetetes cayanensis]|uniref:uncharacterized protein LOC126651563 n=1 Tax=Myiozetetes cayanensis TaxID=478635 RepID=UPI00215E59FB|nr:uncharacterized protein LOC126651563 [Myiozetetes cayanensis]
MPAPSKIILQVCLMSNGSRSSPPKRLSMRVETTAELSPLSAMASAHRPLPPPALADPFAGHGTYVSLFPSAHHDRHCPPTPPPPPGSSSLFHSCCLPRPSSHFHLHSSLYTKPFSHSAGTHHSSPRRALASHHRPSLLSSPRRRYQLPPPFSFPRGAISRPTGRGLIPKLCGFHNFSSFPASSFHTELPPPLRSCPPADESGLESCGESSPSGVFLSTAESPETGRGGVCVAAPIPNFRDVSQARLCCLPRLLLPPRLSQGSDNFPPRFQACNQSPTDYEPQIRPSQGLPSSLVVREGPPLPGWSSCPAAFHPSSGEIPSRCPGSLRATRGSAPLETR